MPRWSKIVGVWVGMLGLWLLVYGLVVELPVQRGYMPAAAGGYIALVVTGLLIWLAVHLTRRVPTVTPSAGRSSPSKRR
jgi:hypothetical protein